MQIPLVAQLWEQQTMTEQPSPDVRPSPIAGTAWYPGSAHALSQMIDGFLNVSVEPPPGQIIGLIAPHAGLEYSGAVAGYAFALARTLQPDLVAVLSPSHRLYPAPLLTTDHHVYRTPLGDIAVDGAAVEALAARVPLAKVRHDQEHSLEIELPFLQRALAQPFTLLPLMLVEQSVAVVERLGHALAEVLRGRNALIVASSDLSHYYPQDLANRLDRYMLGRVAAFDPLGVLEAEERQQGFACGRGAIAAALWAARDLGADSARVLHYATSGDVTGNYRNVVGYGAGVIFRRAA